MKIFHFFNYSLTPSRKRCDCFNKRKCAVKKIKIKIFFFIPRRQVPGPNVFVYVSVAVPV